jgi:hypothetical protein
MTHHFVTGAAMVLAALFVAAPAAQADPAAAEACAAKLSQDGQAIFNATLPSLGPGVDLRETVTAHTRSLAMAGTIARDPARSNAMAAASCLRLEGH